MKFAMLFIFTASLMHGLTAEYTETRSVEAGTVLDVYNANGDITVTGWDGDKVEINIVKKTDRGAAELDNASCEISAGAKLVVETKYKDEKNVHVSVAYSIKVPPHVRVGSLKTANGDIVITGVEGDIELHTANGDIKATGVDRLIKAITSNGEIRAELKSIADEGVKIISANGSITVALDKGLDCELTASTVNGKVSVKGLNLGDLTTCCRSVTGSVGEGGPEVKVTTVNGQVKISSMAD